MMHPGRIAVAFAVLLVASGARAAEGAEYAFHHENVMGTSLELRVSAVDPASAAEAERRVLAEVDRLSAILSGYDARSEFRRWQDTPGGPTAVAPEFWEVLATADRWRERTGGAFEPKVEGLSRLWKACAAEARAPTPGEIDRERAALARPAWRLDPVAKTAQRLPGGPITLDAIAKGAIVGRAAEAGMEAVGVIGLLLNVGGDMRVCGAFAPEIGIANPGEDSESSPPIARIVVRDQGVATSGRSQRGFWVGSRRYSHIIDPRTGRPADGVASATVIAPSSTDADALATALNVLKPEEGITLLDATPGAAGLIVDHGGRISRSAGWARYDRTPSPGPAVALAMLQPPPSPAHWGDAFELAIDFEIGRPEAERYRRPYVAVWVEDKARFPVRNLAIWVSLGGAGPDQWLPDLTRWSRGERVRKEVEKGDTVQTMGRPTRQPGKYTVIWDGKDGKKRPLPPGEYTINIESAREHGTHQIIRKAVTIAETPFAEDLPGNVEIKSAAISYRRKAAKP